ncbi:MAG: HAD-IIB family hydrolase [Nitrospirota bacterium]
MFYTIPMGQFIVFTDLDGTLLDHTYSCTAALPALRLLKERKTPLVLCSSKTKAEIEHYRKKLDNRDPFIAENGGGIFLPKGYFSFSDIEGYTFVEDGEYLMLRLGTPYTALRKALRELRSQGFRVRGFGDLSVSEIARLTGLSNDEAAMARERDFDEPFIFEGDNEQALTEAIAAKGFNVIRGGAFFHLLGSSDKGTAVSLLIDMYKRHYGGCTTIALGDGPNDLPMLERVDHPVIVQRTDGTYDPRITLPGLIKAEGIGPEGWDKAVISLLSRIH